MKECKDCIHAMCKIPVKNYKKHKNNPLYGKLIYGKVEIRCDKNQWSRGANPYIYKGPLDKFENGKFIKVCKYYER